MITDRNFGRLKTARYSARMRAS